jgi:hypothetical protein
LNNKFNKIGDEHKDVKKKKKKKKKKKEGFFFFFSRQIKEKWKGNYKRSDQPKQQPKPNQIVKQIQDKSKQTR